MDNFWKYLATAVLSATLGGFIVDNANKPSVFNLVDLDGDGKREAVVYMRNSVLNHRTVFVESGEEYIRLDKAKEQAVSGLESELNSVQADIDSVKASYDNLQSTANEIRFK